MRRPGSDGGIPVAGRMQLCHLLSGAQEPKERSTYCQTRKMHQRGEPAKGGAKYQKLVGWTGHELPSGLTLEVSRPGTRKLGAEDATPTRPLNGASGPGSA